MPMNDEARAMLRRMFEADLFDPDYYRKHEPYAVDVLLGLPPFWPPLAQVWSLQGEVADYDRGRPIAAHWPAAWALLGRLHRESVYSRK